jgi:hypothetical protein
MRLIKLGIYDPAYLAAFYQARPALRDAAYAEQHRALIDDRAASSDFWTAALAKRGYEAADIIANAGPLQQSWAREHALGLTDLFAITAAQVRLFAPEIVLVADYSTFTPAFLRELRANSPSIRRIVGWCGAAYRDLAVMREWDLALSCIPEVVRDFRAAGLDAHHVNHGFDPRLLAQLGPVGVTAGFSFVGSVVKQPGFHEARETLLVHLLDRTPLELWSAMPAPGHPLRRLAAQLRPGRSKPLHPLIARRARSPLYGLAMFRQLRDSAVTLNTHIDVSPNSASNMRLFEATGVGACLLTDRKDNLAELFTPDSEVMTYASPAEAVEKYLYLADRPAERARIAAAGQRRALRDHNFDRRAERIDAILRRAVA